MIRRRPVRHELLGCVTDIVAYHEAGVGLVGATEAASLVIPFVISFGGPFNIGLGRSPGAGDHWTSFAAGLYRGPVTIASAGTSSCIQVNFTPAAARRFFGIPMRELASRMVRIDELGDPEIARLRQRLGDEPRWRRRLDLVEQFAVARLRRARPAPGVADAAYRHIMAVRGNIRISALARKLDCSRKHLAERFGDEIGLSPKSIARIVRFRNAMARAGASDDPDWADIAFGCGFADQAHLAREFTALAGDSPARWRKNTA